MPAFALMAPAIDLNLDPQLALFTGCVQLRYKNESALTAWQRNGTLLTLQGCSSSSCPLKVSPQCWQQLISPPLLATVDQSTLLATVDQSAIYRRWLTPFFRHIAGVRTGHGCRRSQQH